VNELVDLSHALGDGTEAYPGLPAMRVRALLEREASRERYGGQAAFLLAGFEIAGNTGTYLDAPFHRFADGADLAAVPLASCAALEGVCIDVDVASGRAVPLDAYDDDAFAGRAVLFRSGWDARWGTDRYWQDAPFLPADAVERLVEAGATLVGVDFGNVDDTADLARPAHSGLLAAGIPIVENLANLGVLPADGFVFTAAPLAIVGGATFPVRAFAELR
jgi:kynurenine formamidase